VADVRSLQFESKDERVGVTLDEFVREKARGMIATALEAEVDECVSLVRG
jgi:hypothetical protein